MEQAAIEPAPILVPIIDEQYGPIQPSEDYLLQLKALIHSNGVLQKSGYILHEFSSSDLDKKRRCDRCHRHLPSSFTKLQLSPKAKVRMGPGLDEQAEVAPESSKDASLKAPKETTAKEPFFHCKFHPGRVAYGRWTCCSGNTFSPPCEGKETHIPKSYAPGELERNWRFFLTPPFRANAKPAIAVVIDCEMGTAASGESELIRVTAVDYFTRVVLLDSLVWPDVKMAHYNTRFSGVRARDMETARRQRKCIFGRNNARKALWQFVGQETIIIGHACHGDLTSLRWIHTVMIDTLILETKNRPPPGSKIKTDNAEGEAEGSKKKYDPGASAAGEGIDPVIVGNGELKRPPKKRKEGGLSLKALALQRLNRVIQPNGRGHDSLEDSLATRDILHWNVNNGGFSTLSEAS